MIPKLGEVTQLVSISQLAGAFARDPILDLHPEIQMEVDVDHETTVRVDPKTRVGQVEIRLTIRPRPVESEYKDARPFRVESIYRVLYHAPGFEGTDSLFKRAMNTFCHTSTLSHVWPYWRKYVADSTQAMGMPQLLVPLLVMPQLKVQKPKAKSKS